MMPPTRCFTGLAAAAALLLCAAARAQLVRPNTGASAVEQRIEKLRVTGSLLMVAAHPDDENNRALAYYALGRKLRTAYLSLTRGEGGQNLIGGEQGPLLGVIRTEELLMARRVDGAEQYFSGAIDYGFSKTAAEALSMWGHEATLADLVWRIRCFRPDVIVLSFTGTPRDGHGHHQASAMLAKEAFAGAADPAKFPEQLKYVQPWRAKRVVWNTFFGRARDLYPDAREQTIDTGEYNAALGASYAEIGGWSRTQHRSQAQGSAEPKGPSPVYLVTVEGDPFTTDFMDGVDTSWHRYAGGAAVEAALGQALAALRCDDPAAAVPALVKARAAVRAMDNADARARLNEFDEAIAAAAGLWLDVTAGTQAATPSSDVALEMTALNRSPLAMTLELAQVEGLAGAPAFPAGVVLAGNAPQTARATLRIPPDTPPTGPYWLERPRAGWRYDVRDRMLAGRAENPPLLICRFRIRVGEETIELVRPVVHRVTDHLRGDVDQPFVVVPPVSLAMPEHVLMFCDGQARAITVGVVANTGHASGQLQLSAPAGWRVEPRERSFALTKSGQQQQLGFTVTPPAAAGSGELKATAQVGAARLTQGLIRLNYEHIPLQTIQPPAVTSLVRADVRLAARRIGYVMGAGDAVPEALAQMGAEVTLLDASDLAQADLAKYDAIVTGVRAWNVREDLRANAARLWRYVEQGGTVVAQYTVLEGYNAAPRSDDTLGPYPLTLSRSRVTVEDAPVTVLDAASPLLHWPNEITARDWEGWVQERGLYFPSAWDAHYHTLIACHDPGEAELAGGILAARYGRGVYIYTSYSWFRELPAGVAGAWRIFANLVSAGRAVSMPHNGGR